MGYWVRASGNGSFVVRSVVSGNKTVARQQSSHAEPKPKVSLWLKDPAGHRQTLSVIEADEATQMYDLPPVPPDGGFDVRFQSQKFIECYSENADHRRYNIQLQSPSYPVIIGWDCSLLVGASAELVIDGAGKSLSGKGEMALIANPKAMALLVGSHLSENTPTSYRLYQNYPNPFNPSTTIEYDLHRNSLVTMEVFNVLGERVTNLVHENQSAGHHILNWSAVGLSSGIYHYRLTVVENGFSKVVFDARKSMILIK